MSYSYLNKHQKLSQKRKNWPEFFLLSRISNYEARAKRESSNMAIEKKSLAAPDIYK